MCRRPAGTSPARPRGRQKQPRTRPLAHSPKAGRRAPCTGRGHGARLGLRGPGGGHGTRCPVLPGALPRSSSCRANTRRPEGACASPPALRGPPGPRSASYGACVRVCVVTASHLHSGSLFPVQRRRGTRPPSRGGLRKHLADSAWAGVSVSVGASPLGGTSSAKERWGAVARPHGSPVPLAGVSPGQGWPARPGDLRSAGPEPQHESKRQRLLRCAAPSQRSAGRPRCRLVSVLSVPGRAFASCFQLLSTLQSKGPAMGGQACFSAPEHAPRPRPRSPANPSPWGPPSPPPSLAFLFLPREGASEGSSWPFGHRRAVCEPGDRGAGQPIAHGADHAHVSRFAICWRSLARGRGHPGRGGRVLGSYFSVLGRGAGIHGFN